MGEISLTAVPVTRARASREAWSRSDAAEGRRVLVVAPELPSPPTWGFALRVHHLARHLSTRHRVRLLAYGPPGRVPSVPAVFESVELVAPPPGPAKRLGQLASVATVHAYHMRSRASTEMQLALDRTVERWAPDVVQIESSIMSWLRVPEGPVVVLDEHNIESELLLRIARAERTPARAAFGRLEAWKARRGELLAWERTDGVTVTSSRDQESLSRRLPDAWTCVVPNGVDLEEWRPAGEGAAAADHLVFVVSINYRPNTDAVLHLVHDILPLIRRQRPSVRVTVVGQGAPEAVRRLESPHVDFAGAVADVRPFVARAAAVVVPLRFGGGTRLKILEALAMGKPVVTTRIGCEGIDAVDGQHLMIAGSAADFAGRVCDVLASATLRRSLGAAGRALVENRYGWTQAGERLDAFHTTLHARTTGG